MNDTESQSKPERVECPATTDLRLLAVGVGMIGLGVWCFVEAYVMDEHPYKPFSQDINDWASWAFNHIGAFAFFAVGALLLVRALMAMRRRLVADAEGIGYVGKERIPWTGVRPITGGDESQLRDKQILCLHHGNNETLKLDAYKLKNFRELVAFVEDHVQTARPQEPTRADDSPGSE